MVAEICKRTPKAKRVNLVTRLKGEAYGFFRSCTTQQKATYEGVVAELKRFTPVRIQSVESSMFHDRKQGKEETVDQYAQEPIPESLSPDPAGQ